MKSSEYNVEKFASELADILTIFPIIKTAPQISEYYSQQIESIATLHQKQKQLEKQKTPDAKNEQRERTPDQLLKDEMEKINNELSLYKEVIDALKVEISHINEELKKASPEDIETIKKLKAILANVSADLKKKENELIIKEKKLKDVKHKKESLQALIKLEKKQKKELNNARSAEIDSMAVFLLPGKLLEAYKKDLETKIAKFSHTLPETRAEIESTKKSIKEEYGLQTKDSSSRAKKGSEDKSIGLEGGKSRYSIKSASKESSQQISSNVPKLLKVMLDGIDAQASIVANGSIVSPPPQISTTIVAAEEKAAKEKQETEQEQKKQEETKKLEEEKKKNEEEQKQKEEENAAQEKKELEKDRKKEAEEELKDAEKEVSRIIGTIEEATKISPPDATPPLDKANKIEKDSSGHSR